MCMHLLPNSAYSIALGASDASDVVMPCPIISRTWVSVHNCERGKGIFGCGVNRVD